MSATNLLLLFGRQAAGGGAPPAGISLTDLIAYYALEEASGTREDAHTGSKDLGDGSATLGSDTGKIGDAAEFDRTVPHFLFRADADFLLDTANFTVAAWVYAATLDAGDATNGAGVGRYMASEAAGSWSIGVLPDGGLTCRHWKTAGNDATGRHTTTSGGLVTATTWHHILFRRESGVYTIWVDGVSRAFADTLTDSGWGGANFEVGRNYHAGGGPHWNGRIDCFGVWERALSAGEIAILAAGVAEFPWE